MNPRKNTTVHTTPSAINTIPAASMLTPPPMSVLIIFLPMTKILYHKFSKKSTLKSKKFHFCKVS